MDKTTCTKRWLWPALAAVLIIAVVLLLVFHPWSRAKKAGNPFDIPGYTMLENSPCGEIGEGLYLTNVGSYTGNFMEDGTDEPVENVLGMIVENQSGEIVEYAVLTLRCGETTVQFRISGLPAGASVLVLAQERTSAEGAAPTQPPELTQCAFAQNAVEDYSADFQLYNSTGVVNIENISGHDFSEAVSVCYKNYQYGLYLGGITYRARIENGIASGAIAQSIQSHYNDETSAVVYMLYVE